MKNLFLLLENDFIRKQIVKLVERIHYPYENDEEKKHCLEKTASESILLSQLTLQEKLELETGKSKRTIDFKTQKDFDLK